jgi:hypothetical protein
MNSERPPKTKAPEGSRGESTKAAAGFCRMRFLDRPDCGPNCRLSIDKPIMPSNGLRWAVPLFRAAGAMSALRPIQERLIVMMRGVRDEHFASTMAADRHVPVLMIEPKETPAQPRRTARTN